MPYRNINIISESMIRMLIGESIAEFDGVKQSFAVSSIQPNIYNVKFISDTQNAPKIYDSIIRFIAESNEIQYISSYYKINDIISFGPLKHTIIDEKRGENDEPKDPIQYSFRALVILMILFSVFSAVFATFVAEFIQQNYHKIKGKQ